jgi:hypothetical protein
MFLCTVGLYRGQDCVLVYLRFVHRATLCSCVPKVCTDAVQKVSAIFSTCFRIKVNC